MGAIGALNQDIICPRGTHTIHYVFWRHEGQSVPLYSADLEHPYDPRIVFCVPLSRLHQNQPDRLSFYPDTAACSRLLVRPLEMSTAAVENARRYRAGPRSESLHASPPGETLARAALPVGET
jgi:hypothetical protein